MIDKNYLKLLNLLFHYRFPESSKLRKDIENKFDIFQKKTGLLQFYIYTTKMDSSTREFHLLPWMESEELKRLVPWEPNDILKFKWYKNLYKEEDELKKVEHINHFKEIRENEKETPPEFLTIFRDLFDIKDNIPLSDEEKKYTFLLVSDGELSLFSFLYMLCLDNRDKWKTHEGLFELLGFINPDSESSLPALTKRYFRMLSWIKKENSKKHPALAIRKFPFSKPEEKQLTLGDILSSLVNTDDFKKMKSPKNITEAFINKLIHFQFENGNIPCPILKSREAFLKIPTIRYNIEGELELRKYEDISRSFFATPLMYVKSEKGEHSTFAVGTIQDFENFSNKKKIQKIQKLKFALNYLSRKKADENVSIDHEIQNRKLNEQIIEIKKHATKAAISQVMARNMSHNIGSHVIPYLVKKKYDDKEIEKYNRYIQERMELIATVSTTFPFYLKTETTIKEITDEFKDNLIVKNGIVDGSLGIEFFSDNALMPFHLPGGQIGKQLMFSFIEGLIRNCKKHSSPINNDGVKQIDIHFKIQDYNSDYYSLEIIDGLGKVNSDRIKQTLENIRKYLFDSIIENSELRKGGWGLLELKIAAALFIGVPQEDLDLFKNANDIIIIDDKNYPPIIDVGFYDNSLKRCDDENGTYKNIGYKVYILKPKMFYIDSIDSLNQIMSLNVNKDSIVNTNNFSLSETCDFYIGSNTNNPLSNYRNIPEFSSCMNDSIKNCKPFLECIWSKWINEKFGNLVNKDFKEVNQESSETNLNSKIVFDCHGDWLAKMIKNKSDFYDSFKPEFYQPYNTKSSLGDLLNKLSDDVITKHKLIESIGTSISIFDERIQEETKVKDHEGIPIKLIDIFCKMGIYIPNYTNKDEANCLLGFIDSEHDNVIFEDHFLLNQIKERFKQDKYVLIHHTIFEIISFQVNGSKSPSNLNKLYNDIYSKFNLLNKQLIIISGLGLPSNLPDICYFLNLVTVQNLLLVMKSKFHLIQALQSLRPIQIKTK